MIRNSFIIFEGIGPAKEKRIWKQGIRGWDDFLKARTIKGIADKKKAYFDRQIERASRALLEDDSKYFLDKLKPKDCWRLYDHLKEETVFLDIEASGVRDDSYITMIGLFDGFESKTMIMGQNLDLKTLKEELSKYKLIVTYNGATFDMPFIRKRYDKLLPVIPHWDLRSSCAKVGLKGGLKMIEAELGIIRTNPIVERMYGGDPFKLFRMARGSGDDHYLKLLVEYNEEDVVNLKQIADHVYDKLYTSLK